MLSTFGKNGGEGKPTQADYKVCWGTDDDTAHRLWANSGLPGEASQILPSPKHVGQAYQVATVEMTRDSIAYRAMLLRLFRDDVLPRLRQC